MEEEIATLDHRLRNRLTLGVKLLLLLSAAALVGAGWMALAHHQDTVFRQELQRSRRGL